MIKFSKEHIHKQWSWDILLSEKEKIITRCEKIEYFSKKLVNIPETTFYFNKIGVFQKQLRIFETSPISTHYNAKKISELSNSLEILRKEGLVHGDICPRNILWSKKEQRYFIIDWEPDFHQIRNGKKVVVTVANYIHPDEKWNYNPCSIKSDKYAFNKIMTNLIKSSFGPKVNDQM